MDIGGTAVIAGSIIGAIVVIGSLFGGIWYRVGKMEGKIAEKHNGTLTNIDNKLVLFGEKVDDLCDKHKSHVKDSDRRFRNIERKLDAS